MTHDTFVKKYQGRGVDFDGKFGFQCVDLMRQYIKEVFKLNGYVIPPVRYAKDIFNTFHDSSFFKRVFNGPDNFPPQGAIIIWKTFPFITGIAGHVAIVDSANPNNFISFDQNWPTGTLCHLQKHSYKGVLGWLVKK